MRLPGRTDNAAKHHFKVMQRKVNGDATGSTATGEAQTKPPSTSQVSTVQVPAAVPDPLFVLTLIDSIH